MNKVIAVVACSYCLVALAGTAPVKLQVTPGQQQPVTLSRLHLNRVVTPFDSPQVRTIDQADIRIEGSVIYLSSQQAEPFVVYLAPRDNETHALSLLVTLLDIPPREIQLSLPSQWQQKMSGKHNTARKWEESTDYEQAITGLLATLVKGQVPEGYELLRFKNTSFQPCQHFTCRTGNTTTGCSELESLTGFKQLYRTSGYRTSTPAAKNHSYAQCDLLPGFVTRIETKRRTQFNSLARR